MGRRAVCPTAASCGLTHAALPDHACRSRLRPLDLKRHLLRRGLFALIVLVLGAAVTLLEVRHRVRGDIQHGRRTAITDEISRSYSAYDASLTGLKLDIAPIRAIGQVLNFIEIGDFHSHAVYRQSASPSRLPGPWRPSCRRIGADAFRQHRPISRHHRRAIGRHPELRPGAGADQRLANLVAVVMILLSFFVYRPVRNALARPRRSWGPSTAWSDLRARMPEFARRAQPHRQEGFNHLCRKPPGKRNSQQKLAHRLLSVRRTPPWPRLTMSSASIWRRCSERPSPANFADEGVPAL